MFKGLRTKIESEQKGQSPSRQDKTVTVTQENNFSHKEQAEINSIAFDPSNDSSQIIVEQNDSTLNELSSSVLEASSNEPSVPEPSLLVGVQDQEIITPFQTITELKDKILELNDQLKYVIKERDESNDQNTQLYQLIEKLRRNLETEKETNTSLQNRLNQVEGVLKEREDFNNHKGINVTSKSISVKSFEFNDASNTSAESSDNHRNLRAKINDLQSLLSEKTRQLKIRQQNMNDIKKALQKEIADHSKTQEELCKLQNQLKQMHGRNDTNGNEVLQNGSFTGDIDAVPKANLIPFSDKNQEAKDACDETARGAHLESISNLSSNASVDDFDSNDLQQNNKEVNHEYLRNVLFRYMTSTDTETTQHLVKAISVLMNFTPEQSAAVKSAMYSKSSWLRLKK